MPHEIQQVGKEGSPQPFPDCLSASLQALCQVLVALFFWLLSSGFFNMAIFS